MLCTSLRMKTLSVLLMLNIPLLTPTYSKELCRKEVQQTRYYIYNSNIDLDIYQCLYNSGLSCEQLNVGETVDSYPKRIGNICNSTRNPTVTVENIVLDPSNNNLTSFRVCKSSAKTRLLQGVVTLPSDKVCNYFAGSCSDENDKHYIWDPRPTCNSMQLIYNSSFNVYSVEEKETKYILDDYVSLKLIRKQSLCGFRMLITNYDGIFASINYYTDVDKNNSTILNFQSTVGEDCGITDKTIKNISKNNTIEAPKTWYVYNYFKNVTIHYCVDDVNKSCDFMGLGKKVSNESLLNRCRISCDTCKPDITVCEDVRQVNMRDGYVKGLPLYCSYSDGFCQTFKYTAFWQFGDQCKSVQEIPGQFTGTCSKRNCVITSQNLSLTFVRLRTMCDVDVWYTNVSGLAAADKILPLASNLEVPIVNVL